MQVDKACIPSPRSWQMLESSSSLKCQKWSSDLIVVPMASRENLRVFLALCRDSAIVYKGLEGLLSSPSNIMQSCFQPVWHSSASVLYQGLRGNQFLKCRRPASPQIG